MVFVTTLSDTAMPSSPTEILETFIADEATHYPQGDQGSFYPQNHHLIGPLVPRAPKLLAPAARVELYFHLLRLGHFPAIKSAEELDLLLAAYTRLTPLLARGYPYCSLNRPTGLFVFGHDDHGPLAAATEPGLDALLARRKSWSYFNSFSHMPGMLKKQPKFLELSADASLVDRVTQTILRISLVDDLTSRTSLWFWALVLLAIQDKEAGRVVVEWLLQADCAPADHAFFRSNTTRYLRASSRDDLLLQFQDALAVSDDDA